MHKRDPESRTFSKLDDGNLKPFEREKGKPNQPLAASAIGGKSSFQDGHPAFVPLKLYDRSRDMDTIRLKIQSPSSDYDVHPSVRGNTNLQNGTGCYGSLRAVQSAHLASVISTRELNNRLAVTERRAEAAEERAEAAEELNRALQQNNREQSKLIQLLLNGGEQMQRSRQGDRIGSNNNSADEAAPIMNLDD